MRVIFLLAGQPVGQTTQKTRIVFNWQRHLIFPVAQSIGLIYYRSGDPVEPCKKQVQSAAIK